MFSSFRLVIQIRFIAAASASAALLLTGCSTTNRVALDPARRGPVHATHPFVAVPQDSIGVDINRSHITAATGGGLIFALVDSAIDHSRSKQADALVVPVREAIADFDIGQGLSAALTGELGKVEWLQAGPVAVHRAGFIPPSSATDPDLIVDCDYRFSFGFASVAVTAQVTLRAPSASSEQPPLYRNTFSTIWDLPGCTTCTEPADRVKVWANERGAVTRRVLGDSFRDLAAMIAYDIGLPATATHARKEGGIKTGITPVPNRFLPVPPRSGNLEREHGERAWVRLDSGELVSESH